MNKRKIIAITGNIAGGKSKVVRKIATKLGWYPETSFNTGIEKTIRWYLENQAWVESVASGDYQQYYEQMYHNRQ